MVESWAIAFQYYIVNLEYSDYGYSSTFGDNFQDWPYKNYENEYFPLFINLMDNYNQRAVWGDNRPVDNVNGYTITQIENAIKGAKTLEKWRDNLRDKYDNPTENNLDELFNNYINWR